MASDTIKRRQAKLKKLFLEQLKRTPTIEQACHKVGVTRMTVRRWRKANKRFNQEVETALREGRELMSDIIESQLFSQAGQGEPGMVKFFLAHNNPRYANKLELSGKVEANDLSAEQKKIIRRALKLSSIANHEKQRKGKTHRKDSRG